MPLHLYDTYSRSVREFAPLHADEPVGLYACGPTVYDYAHIGNLRTYLFEDMLRRTLEWNGYQVRHVVNITDVGHLTSDADTGEDKIEQGSRRTGKSAWDIAEHYAAAFVHDLDLLNIRPPTIWCRATDHIADQIAFIADLEQKAYTYRTADGIYFDTSRQDDYGYLARLDRAGLQAGKRVDQGEKKHVSDFALWKFSKPGEQRQMEWPSPWGTGFPGWHIECSAMSARHLGAFFDIHCGGEDHIPVHHSNEIAQTEARYGTRLANFWLHASFLNLNAVRMSKSSGDFLRLQSLIDDAYDPLAYRYLCLTAHYRSQLRFTFDALDAAAVALDRLRNTVYRLGAAGEPSVVHVERFMAEINDDLNFPRALAIVWEVAKSDLPNDVKKASLLRFDDALGLELDAWKPEAEETPEAIERLLQARGNARADKRWADADRIRTQIFDCGYEVEDTPSGQRVVKTFT